MRKKGLLLLLLLCWSPGTLFAFTFDDWNSGMTLDEVLTISERKDIPLMRSGLLGRKEHFDPETSWVYADVARTFYYKTLLVDEPAKVELQFTEESRRLFEVRISWQGINIKKELPPTVEAMLNKKYGNATKRRKMFIKDEIWHLDKNNQLIMKKSGAALHLRYTDLKLEKADADEKRRRDEIEREKAIKKDLKIDFCMMVRPPVLTD